MGLTGCIITDMDADALPNNDRKEVDAVRSGHIKYHLMNIGQLLRPQFLVASIVLFSIGVLATGGRIDLADNIFLAALTAVVLVQLSCGLINEYCDWLGDRFARKSFFAGGSGVVASGMVSPATALAGAIVSISIASALSIWVMAQVPDRSLFLPVLLSSAALGWAYSVRPVRLVSSGGGELIVAFLLAFAVPFLGAYMVSGTFDAALLPFSLPLFFFALAAIIAVEYPDKQADIRAVKRNLTYRLGLRLSAMVQSLSVFIGFGLTAVFLLLGDLHWIGTLLFIALPFAWAAGTVMAFSKYYDHFQATVATAVIMFTFVTAMLLQLLGLLLKL
jgi:1,4-dihydroxy-2-naphthoate octaprenyltransferase